MAENRFSVPGTWLERPVKTVLVGVGGIGSHLLDELARMDMTLKALEGHGFRVTVFDPDSVAVANVGLQRFLPSDVGYPKAEVLANRYRSFMDFHCEAITDYFRPEQASGFDLVVTAVDKARLRYDLGSYWQDHRSHPGIWLDAGVDHHSGQVVLGSLDLPDTGLKLPNVFDLMGDGLKAVNDNATDSCSQEEALRNQDFGVGATAARHASALLWNLLRHGGIAHHGCFFSLETGEVRSIRIDPVVWQSFGYTG